jgi:hypothetical protein
VPGRLSHPARIEDEGAEDVIMLRLKKPARRSGVAAALVVLATGYLVAAAAAAPGGPAPAASLTSLISPGRPPTPVIRQAPSGQTFSTTAKFTYTDAAPHVSFHCYLNSPPAANCSPSGITYTLPIGYWCFYVYVTDKIGKASRPARYCWAILYKPPPFPHRHRHHPRKPKPANFAVVGSLTSPLYPGVSEPLDLTFTNPNPQPITIAAGGITAANIAVTTSVAACRSSNFAVSQGLTVSVTIPARTTTPVSLMSLGIPPADWPVITMVNTNTNQDACQGATLTLHYSGIEATG